MNDSVLFSDLALAHRLEAAEARAGAASADPLSRLHPELGAAVEDVAGGLAVFAGVGSPLSEGRGCGLAGPVTPEEVARLEEFFVSRGDALRIEICAMADPSLTMTLSKRGFVITEFVSVLARRLTAEVGSSGRTSADKSGTGVRPIATTEKAAWAAVVAAGFAEHFAATRELQQLLECAALASGALAFLAYQDGVPAGGGALFIHEGVALLGGAATLPAFRKRGIQTALVKARLNHAARLGCDLASSSTQPGSASQRNLERQGFRVVYNRFKMARV